MVNIPTIPEIFLNPPVKSEASPWNTAVDALPKSVKVFKSLSPNGSHSYVTLRDKPMLPHLYVSFETYSLVTTKDLTCGSL